MNFLFVSLPPAAAELWSPGFPACGRSPAADPPGGAAARLRSDWTGSLLLTCVVVQDEDKTMMTSK